MYMYCTYMQCERSDLTRIGTQEEKQAGVVSKAMTADGRVVAVVIVVVVLVIARLCIGSSSLLPAIVFQQWRSGQEGREGCRWRE